MVEFCKKLRVIFPRIFSQILAQIFAEINVVQNIPQIFAILFAVIIALRKYYRKTKRKYLRIANGSAKKSDEYLWLLTKKNSLMALMFKMLDLCISNSIE